MDRERIEQTFRAAEEFSKVGYVGPNGMKVFLNKLQDLENYNKKDITDITATVIEVICDLMLEDNCDMKPLTIYKEVKSRVSHEW